MSEIFKNDMNEMPKWHPIKNVFDEPFEMSNMTFEWEKINEYTYKCSNCGYCILYGKWSCFINNNTLLKPKYCDNCGYEMRE